MLHVTAIIRAQAEHVEAVGQALKTLALASRSEAGCSTYELFQKSGEPVFVTREIWADAAAEAAHMKGPNVAAVVGSVGQYLAGPPEIYRCTQLV